MLSKSILQEQIALVGDARSPLLTPSLDPRLSLPFSLLSPRLDNIRTYGSSAASSKIAAFDLVSALFEEKKAENKRKGCTFFLLSATTGKARPSLFFLLKITKKKKTISLPSKNQDGTLVVEGAAWRRERSLGPAKPGDFVFFRRDVPEILRACAERGEHVALFSNQGTIQGKILDGKNAWKHTRRMDLVNEAFGGVPMTVVFATAAKVCFASVSFFVRLRFFFLGVAADVVGVCSFSPRLALSSTLSLRLFFSLSFLSPQAQNDPHRKPGRGMWDLFVSKLAPAG